jgi:hypothetical protein
MTRTEIEKTLDKITFMLLPLPLDVKLEILARLPEMIFANSRDTANGANLTLGTPPIGRSDSRNRP